MKKEKEPKKFDIFLVNVGRNNGSVQRGYRPCLIVQNNMGNYYSPTLIIACLSSVIKKLNLPTHVLIEKGYGLKTDSILLAEQLFTIDRSALGDFIGSVTREQDRNRINLALETSLGLQL